MTMAARTTSTTVPPLSGWVCDRVGQPARIIRSAELRTDMATAEFCEMSWESPRKGVTGGADTKAV
jgi:hypothetical protein